MGSNAFFSSILYCFLLATSASAAPFISDHIFETEASTGRALLQAKKACKVDFENQNYTVLTSQCKGPQYPAKVCCDAFKQFACPFAGDINDLSTNCAEVMFSYINIYGKYPPGLFANECKGGELGLDCSDVKPANQSSTSHTINLPPPPFISLISIAFFLFFLLSSFSTFY
ncbi:GPI-anchored protein LLG3-like [Vigna umbellata]|uniref:GPI-anchored protein LLG3-like n=1 Tax=Vigna umbellata TaxID=87088 RepID=UPI001F5E9364|nr:GPI-anchored protein LLG3-like [Vigna umbellata]